MANHVATLFHKQARLFAELQAVAQELAQVIAVGGKATPAAPAPSAKAGKRKKWFERGEAGALMKKFGSKPIAQADLVRAILSSKGYDKGLSAADKKRVQSATYQAIANAVAAKSVVVGRDGRVVVKR